MRRRVCTARYARFFWVRHAAPTKHGQHKHRDLRANCTITSSMLFVAFQGMAAQQARGPSVHPRRHCSGHASYQRPRPALQQESLTRFQQSTSHLLQQAASFSLIWCLFRQMRFVSEKSIPIPDVIFKFHGVIFGLAINVAAPLVEGAPPPQTFDDSL